jgi:hypothetical protein
VLQAALSILFMPTSISHVLGSGWWADLLKYRGTLAQIVF